MGRNVLRHAWWFQWEFQNEFQKVRTIWQAIGTFGQVFR